MTDDTATAQPHTPLLCDKCGGDLLQDPEMAMVFWTEEPVGGQVGRLLFAHKVRCDPHHYNRSRELAWLVDDPGGQLADLLRAYRFTAAQVQKLAAASVVVEHYRKVAA